jgi:hypothetical protein
MDDVRVDQSIDIGDVDAGALRDLFASEHAVTVSRPVTR